MHKLITVCCISNSISYLLSNYFADFRSSTIYEYSTSLIGAWVKAFTIGHAILRKSVTRKLQRVVEEYYNSVYTKSTINDAIPSFNKEPLLFEFSLPALSSVTVCPVFLLSQVVLFGMFLPPTDQGT